METNLEGVLTIKDKEGELIAVVFNDMKRRCQVFYACKQMSVDEIQQLLDSKQETK